MKQGFSKSLVPALKRIPGLVRHDDMAGDGAGNERARAGYGQEARSFDLVQAETHLHNTMQVERFLPDILGRALARSWIDKQFQSRFTDNPVDTLEAYGVFLPANIDIQIEMTETMRPRVVVYERQRLGRKTRLLYLQLTMMAGK